MNLITKVVCLPVLTLCFIAGCSEQPTNEDNDYVVEQPDDEGVQSSYGQKMVYNDYNDRPESDAALSPVQFEASDYTPSPVGIENLTSAMRDIVMFVIYPHASKYQLYSTYLNNSDPITTKDGDENEFDDYESLDKFEALLPEMKASAERGRNNNRFVVDIAEFGSLYDNTAALHATVKGISNIVGFEHEMGSNFFSLNNMSSNSNEDTYDLIEVEKPTTNSIPFDIKNYTDGDLYISGIHVENEEQARALQKIPYKSLRGKVYIRFVEMDRNIIDGKKECIDCSKLAYVIDGADLEFYDFNTNQPITNMVRVFPTSIDSPNDSFYFKSNS